MRSVRTNAAGSVARFTATVEADNGTYFCKGVPAGPGPALRAARIEARVNPHLPAARVPRLRWTVEAADWLVLGFDHFPGRHADLGPGPPDLPLVAAVLTELATVLTPCGVPVQPATVRWGDWIDPAVVDGETLVHTDVTPKNFLVSRVGDIQVIDWAMPVLGAAWIDAARMIVRLIRAGNGPGQAEAWASTVPSYAAAPAQKVTAFSLAMARLASYRRTQNAAEHVHQLAAAADAWAAHRTAAQIG
ncbi:hypothetical protein AB0M20_29090 [Actinoplanes sp. NPDC051633]|uniref:hypothetical protein n=1 Tax=Actinoplanes sp. NPDC051633 TaxID=3155670 RepID=UPI003447BAD3